MLERGSWHRLGIISGQMLKIARGKWAVFVAMGIVEALGSVLGFYGAAKLPG